jgi:acyl dehydratase
METSTAGDRGELAFEDVREGQELPAISLDVTYRRVCLNAAATWDWFPGHHDPVYARRQGQRTIYLSTLFFHGFVDRLVTDWAGPGAFIRRRRIRMLRSIYAGQTAVARGRVTAVRREDGRGLVDVEAVVESEEGPCVPAELTVELPLRGEGG